MTKPLIGDMPAPEKLHRLEDEEPEHPIVALLRKHRAWLEAQPEWVMLMALPRPVRREYARQLAYELLGLPVVSIPKKHNRQAQRTSLKKFQRLVVGPALARGNAQPARQAAQAEKSRRRYQRISAQRAYDLAVREEEARELEEYRKALAPTPEEEYQVQQERGREV